MFFCCFFTSEDKGFKITAPDNLIMYRHILSLGPSRGKVWPPVTTPPRECASTLWLIDVQQGSPS